MKIIDSPFSSSIPVVRLALAYSLLKELLRGNVKGAAIKGIPLSVALAFLSATFGGPRHGLLSTMFGTASFEDYTIGGHVAPGFEKVRETFEWNFKNGYERGAQFVVYHRGRKVVDLWGSKGEDVAGYNGDSTQVCFSCSKVLTSIVVAMAVEKGRLDYDKKVAEYWPEFAASGKENITVADICRHDGGLAYFERKIPVDLLHRESMHEVAEFLASMKPTWNWRNNSPDEEKSRVYHGMSRGFILNELVRRTDPENRSIGEIIKNELADPYGLSITMGKPNAAEKAEMFDLKMESIPDFLMKTLWKTLSGVNDKDDAMRTRAIITQGEKSTTLSALGPVKIPRHMKDYDNGHFMNHPTFHEVEVPSANAISNARALGKLADLLSRTQLLSQEAHDMAHSEPVTKFDHALFLDTTFTKGGWCVFDDEGWDDIFNGYIGWGGYGGSMFAWNTETQVGASYTVVGTYRSSMMGQKDDRCISMMRHVVEATGTSVQSKL